MANIDRASLKDALTSLQKACELHVYDPNVSLIDVGFRILDAQSRKRIDEIAVRVHVRKKIPRGTIFDRFRKEHPEKVPSADKIGFAIDVPEAPYDLHYWYGYYYWTPVTNPRVTVQDPLQGGISISNSLKYGYGTLGGKVVDRQTGEKMILSNWHVLSGLWSARPGVEIYQPGQMDGGGPMHTIGQLSRHAFDRNIDAAVATLTGNRDCINAQLELASVHGVRSPELGMKVVKSGRRSSITSGVVTGIGGVARFYYDGIMRTVRDVVHVSPSHPGAEVSAPGDSGAWWLDAGSQKAVALHFAGSNSPEYGLAISMPEVLDALDVDIALE